MRRLFYCAVLSTIPFAPAYPQAAIPHINPGGAVGAGLSNPPLRQFAAGSMLTVFGANFAPSGTERKVGVEDLVDGRLPVRLNGVCVQVGPVLAPLFHLYPGQITLQVPDLASGDNVLVQVILNCLSNNEIKSNVETISVRSASPELFTFRQNDFGRFPVAAVDAITNEPIGPPDLIPGVVFRPATPGDIITLYGTGFGRTDPGFGAGVLPDRAASTLEPPIVTLGNFVLARQDVLYAGVAPGLAGVNQLNLRIPAEAPDGDVPIRVRVGNLEGPDIAFLTVNRNGTAAARAAQLLRFTGAWVIQDQAGSGIIRAAVRTDLDAVIVHIWGRCPVLECDWGEAFTPASDAGDSALSLTWRTPQKVEIQQLAAQADARLRLSGSVHFVEYAGQPDYTYVSYLVRVFSLMLSPNAVLSGSPVRATITLAEPAPSGGVTVALRSDNSALQVPPILVVPAGQTAWSVDMPTLLVSANTVIRVTATVGTLSREAAFSLMAPPAGIQLPPPQQLSPPDGSVFDLYPRTTTLRWTPLPGAARYGIEWDYSYNGRWCSEIPTCYSYKGLVTTTTYTFDFIGAQPGRWRVWGIDPTGREGAKSGWWGFLYTR